MLISRDICHLVFVWIRRSDKITQISNASLIVADISYDVIVEPSVVGVCIYLRELSSRYKVYENELKLKTEQIKQSIYLEYLASNFSAKRISSSKLILTYISCVSLFVSLKDSVVSSVCVYYIYT